MVCALSMSPAHRKRRANIEWAAGAAGACEITALALLHREFRKDAGRLRAHSVRRLRD